MGISRIQLKNFKSFSEVNIPIVDGFTAIVGPNGSGKSNIIDSILFALGAGSMKQLRASTISDLVNTKAEGKRAEVSLFLKENGKSQVKITRIIDRQGKCIYKLNDQRTTKNQIVEILGTYGIPADMHNVVLQGDLVRIVEMTPKERRQIIDEIAGIAEYDTKKEQALRELEKVEERTREMSILLNERVTYLNELEKEREDALKFQKLKEEERRLHGSIVKTQVKNIQTEMKGIEKELSKGEKEKAKFDSKKDELEGKEDELRKKLDSVNKKISQAGEKEQIGLNKEVEQSRGDLRVIEEKIAGAKDDINRIESELREKQDQILSIAKEVRQEKKKLSALEKDRAGIGKELKDREKKVLEIEKKIHAGGNIQERYEQLIKSFDEKSRELVELQGTLTQLREKIKVKEESLKEEKEEAGNDSQFDKRMKELQSKKASLDRQIDRIERELEGIRNRERLANNTYKEIEKELSSAKDTLTEMRATMRFARLAPSIEAVLKARDEGRLRGIIGTINELCEYPDKYAVAIETASGGRLTYIVTETHSDAIAAVKYLKEKRLGRATFIPLDRIRAPMISSKSEQALKDPAAIDYAINLLRFSKKYRTAFMYIFGDTIVVKDVDAVKRIGVGRCRMVTLDGDRAEVSGVISGGTRKLSGIAGQKRFENLKKEVSRLEAEKSGVMESLRQCREDYDSKQKELSSAGLELREVEVQMEEIGSRLREIEERNQRFNQRIARTLEDVRNMKVQARETLDRIKSLSSETEEIEKEKEKIMKKLEKPENKKALEEIKKANQELSAVQKQFNEAEMSINEINSKIENILLARKNSLEKEISELTEEKKSFESEYRKLNSEKKKLSSEIEKKVKKLEELSSSIRELSKEREKMNRELESLSKRKGQVQYDLEAIQKRLNEFNLRKAKLETKFEDYREEYERFRDVRVIKEEIRVLQDRLEKTRDMIKRIEGRVNLKAIEMFDEQKKEVKDTQKKLEVLEKERESVISLMNEIESKKRAVFMETYSRVESNFREIFAEMASGEGSLVLDVDEENDDLNEAGLDMQVKPKGRDVRRLEAMSGGEKSLTALAFLFAIQLCQPSPFYVLDEADAALDKENSEKIAKMVRSLRGNSQFIIITHNTPLMRVADQIVGVSMGRAGTSVIELKVPELAT